MVGLVAESEFGFSTVFFSVTGSAGSSLISGTLFSKGNSAVLFGTFLDGFLIRALSFLSLFSAGLFAAGLFSLFGSVGFITSATDFGLAA